MSSTVNEQDIRNFANAAGQWWDPKGAFSLLHAMNYARISFILRNVAKNMGQHDLHNLKILDIGVGGGLLSLPMANLGANVIGIDPCTQSIKAAQNIVDKYNVKNISLVNCSVEELVQNSNLKAKKNLFDIVCASEVIEHVDNFDLFMSSINSLLKSNGLLFISTINRTLKSLLFAKVMAEYVMNLVPRGTHLWDNFKKPSEIISALEINNKTTFEISELIGLSLNPITKTWSETSDIKVNYMIMLKKTSK